MAMTVRRGSSSAAKPDRRPDLRVVDDAELRPPHRGRYAPPRFPADLSGLDQQSAWLDRLAGHAMALVHAPAGYGKSAWCAALFNAALAAGWRAAWISFDDADDAATEDEASDALGLFLDGLGLGAVDPGLPAAELAAGLAVRIDSADRLYLLVLDDLDKVADARLPALLSRLMRHPPAQLRLVLAGRGRPDIGIAAIERRGMLLRIGAADLALDDTAAQRLLAHAGVSIAPPIVAAVNALLQGWPAAWRLIAQRPARLGVAIAAPGAAVLAERIGAIVAPFVDDLTVSDRMALQRCAVAPWIDAELCQLLGGGADGATLLPDLAGRNAWVEPCGEPGRYRLHPAVRAALRQGLEPGEAAQLHRIAGRYYARRGLAHHAIDQLLASGDHDEAAALIASTAMPLIEQGAVDRVGGWIEALPPAIVAATPALARASAWLALLQPSAVAWGRAADPEAQVLALLDRAHAGDRPDQTIELYDQVLADADRLPPLLVDMVRATLAQGAARRGLFGLVHDAVRPVMLRHAGQPLDLPGAIAVCAKATAARAQGQLGEAERLLAEARARIAVPGLAAALVEAALARACYERGVIDQAAGLAWSALPFLERSVFQDALIHAFLVAIRVAAGSGQTDRAVSLIDRAELIAFARGWVPLKALCIVERARLRLPQTIDAEAVVAIADEERAITDPLSPAGRGFALLAEMRAYEAIANGDRPRLTMLAGRLLQLAANADDAELRAVATLFNILPQLSGRCDKMVELDTVRFLNRAAGTGLRRTLVDLLDVTGVRAVQNFCSEAYASDCFLALLTLAEPSRRNPALEGGHDAAPGEAFSS